MSKRQRRKRMERRNPDRLHYRMINLARTDRLLDALREGEARPWVGEPSGSRLAYPLYYLVVDCGAFMRIDTDE